MVVYIIKVLFYLIYCSYLACHPARYIVNIIGQNLINDLHSNTFYKFVSQSKVYSWAAHTGLLVFCPLFFIVGLCNTSKSHIVFGATVQAETHFTHFDRPSTVHILNILFGFSFRRSKKAIISFRFH